MCILERELRKIYPNINFRLALDPDCIPLGYPSAEGNMFMFLCMDKDINRNDLSKSIIDICYKYYDYGFGSHLAVFDLKGSNLVYEVDEEILDISYDIFLKPEFVTKDYLNSLTEEEFKKLLSHYDFDYRSIKELIYKLGVEPILIKDTWFIQLFDKHLNHKVIVSDKEFISGCEPFFDSEESAEDYINRYIRKIIKKDLSSMEIFSKKDSNFLDWVIDKFY